jgi:hypothetical protein
VLAIGSAAVGGFLLPGGKSNDSRPAPKPAAAVSLEPERHDPIPASRDNTPLTTVKPEAISTTRLGGEDGPTITPRLPSTDGAYGLAVAIDQQVNKVLADKGIPASALASDAEFLRRIYLDLAGRIPPREKAVAFLDSTDPTKRAKLIDELLASPEYGRHFANIWTDLLVKRDFDNNKNLKTDKFVTWFADQLNQGKGWDSIVTSLVTVEGREDDIPQTFFVMANLDNNQPAPEKLAGAVGNLFMGLPIQCCQCHQHPYVSQWGMQDFWGMAAFFGHLKAEREGAAKGGKGGIATLKEIESQKGTMGKGNNNQKAIAAGAVITIPDPNDPKKNKGTARARLFESTAASIATSAPYRPSLAKWLTSPANPYFARAAANRTWAHFLGRGIVHPIEDMTEKNPATHPALLKLLADDLGQHGFDLKYLIRAIANSQTYQRTSRPTSANRDDDTLYSHAAVKVLTSRQLLDSLTVATSHQERGNVAGAAAKGGVGTGGNPLVRFFDTREYDDDATEFTYGVPQLLRMMNSNLTASSADVAGKLAKASGSNKDKLIEDVYLTTLARRPYPAEAKRMAEYVAKQGDAGKGAAGVFWALLNSAEFVSVR